MNSFEADLILTDGELVTLYLLLKGKEGTLDRAADAVLLKVERILYDRLTIEEIEEIQRRGSAEK